MSQSNTFHISLCMAGSISAGAYTAGVIDYLHEALENWEKAKSNNDPALPSHNTVIDLLGGSSGGGITAALAFFALRSKVDHGKLEADQRTYQFNSDKNIYWKTWVDQTKDDIFSELLKDDDIREGYIPSLLNASFVDEIAEIFRNSIKEAGMDPVSPSFLHEKAELFLTLFNVTGIKYEINSKSPTAKKQFLSEHRDLAHFQWGNTYGNDGRMEVSFDQTKNLDTLLDAAKATGAFPGGLSARLVTREAKYIWDNPFFLKNKFNRTNIVLGKDIVNGTDKYTTLNGDGGTANNEPIEFARDLMLNMRIKDYGDISENSNNELSNDTQKAIKRKGLTDSSVILIDPFPSYDFDLEKPTQDSKHLLSYLPKFIFSLASQLIFDAKDAFEAYDKDNYGLHIIGPSKAGVPKPQYAIACGSLGGFGGFFNKEFRIHDFFLGRANCQSFLRKYFVVDINEPVDTEAYDCVQAVIEGYKDKPDVIERFGYLDEKGKCFVPIIPDVTMMEPIYVTETDGPNQEKIIQYVDPNPLPLYEIEKIETEFFDHYREQMKSRIVKIITSIYDGPWYADLAIELAAKHVDDQIADKIIDYIVSDLKERDLISDQQMINR